MLLVETEAGQSLFSFLPFPAPYQFVVSLLSISTIVIVLEFMSILILNIKYLSSPDRTHQIVELMAGSVIFIDIIVLLQSSCPVHGTGKSIEDIG